MVPARFLTDTSLESLARRLRLLGYDALTVRGARLEELFEIAAREARCVLTASHRHPKRFAAVPVLVVPRADDAGALRLLAATHRPSGAPFSRCPACNVTLMPRHRMEASGEVPGRVLRQVTALTSCPSCGKWYWDGSHVARLRAWFERTLGDAPGATDS